MDDRMTKSKAKIQADFQNLLGDVEELLDASKEGLSKEGEKVRERLTDRVAQLKTRYEDLQESALEHARQAETTVEKTIQKRPLEVLAGTFVVGAFIGWLAGRK